MKINGIYILATAAIIAASCSLSEINKNDRPSRNDIWRNPSSGTDSSAAERRICYITALDYPKDYDWRSDCSMGSVKCSLTVFADEVPVMKVPVGDDYLISSDPDMHRMIDGNLYTDYSTDTETVIKKNAEEIFRYQGREMIIDMAIIGQDIITLGCSREGDGFSLRKNGNIIYGKNNGRPMGKLLVKGESIFFAFCEKISLEEDELERYWLYEDGTARQVAVREDVLKVWDIIIHNDNICYLAQLTGISQPVLVEGEEMKALNMSSGMTIVTGRLFDLEDSVAAETVYTADGSHYTSCIWIDGNLYRLFSAGATISGICTWNSGVYCVFNSSGEDGGGSIFRCGDLLTAPTGYTMMGNNPICASDGILKIGFSSLRGDKPLIWKDGKTSELDVNGFICTLTAD